MYLRMRQHQTHRAYGLVQVSAHVQMLYCTADGANLPKLGIHVQLSTVLIVGISYGGQIGDRHAGESRIGFICLVKAANSNLTSLEIFQSTRTPPFGFDGRSRHLGAVLLRSVFRRARARRGFWGSKVPS